MNLLAIETSGRTGSIALSTRDTVAGRQIPSAREQTEQVLPIIDTLLGEANLRLHELDAIAFGRGPGSFTGLRLAAAISQGLALASGVALLPLSSLAAAAQRAYREAGAERVLVCVDARMGEVYWAGFEIRHGLAEPVIEEQLCRPESLRAPAQSGWLAVGSGFAAHPKALARVLTRTLAVAADLEPAAGDLLPLARRALAQGATVPPEAALPVYLRGKEAWRRQ
jgi:tRNA threonylcarbamoyladenosine biosynthesis protein TsaB